MVPKNCVSFFFQFSADSHFDFDNDFRDRIIESQKYFYVHTEKDKTTSTSTAVPIHTYDAEHIKDEDGQDVLYYEIKKKPEHLPDDVEYYEVDEPSPTTENIGWHYIDWQKINSTKEKTEEDSSNIEDITDMEVVNPGDTIIVENGDYDNLIIPKKTGPLIVRRKQNIGVGILTTTKKYDQIDNSKLASDTPIQPVYGDNLQEFIKEKGVRPVAPSMTGTGENFTYYEDSTGLSIGSHQGRRFTAGEEYDTFEVPENQQVEIPIQHDVTTREPREARRATGSQPGERIATIKNLEYYRSELAQNHQQQEGSVRADVTSQVRWAEPELSQVSKVHGKRSIPSTTIYPKQLSESNNLVKPSRRFAKMQASTYNFSEESQTDKNQNQERTTRLDDVTTKELRPFPIPTVISKRVPNVDFIRDVLEYWTPSTRATRMFYYSSNATEIPMHSVRRNNNKPPFNRDPIQPTEENLSRSRENSNTVNGSQRRIGEFRIKSYRSRKLHAPSNTTKLYRSKYCI